MTGINGNGNGNAEKTYNNSIIEAIDKRKILECQCKNKAFIMFVTPDIKSGGAQIVNMKCVACDRMYPISERGMIGEKASVYTDAMGRKHHTLNAEAGRLGSNLGNNNKGG